jgi:hypothetical protein
MLLLSKHDSAGNGTSLATGLKSVLLTGPRTRTAVVDFVVIVVGVVDDDAVPSLPWSLPEEVCSCYCGLPPAPSAIAASYRHSQRPVW